MHLNAIEDWKMFIQSKGRLDSETIARDEKATEKIRSILKRHVDITLYLARQNLAFQGHDQSSSSTNRGNFIELMNLLATYDPELNAHLQNASATHYIHSDNQNEFIHCIASEIEKSITSEIKEARYFR